jgi:hypothetical protein
VADQLQGVRVSPSAPAGETGVATYRTSATGGSVWFVDVQRIMVMAAQSNLSVSAGGGQPSCSSDVIARADAGREHDSKIRIYMCVGRLESDSYFATVQQDTEK